MWATLQASGTKRFTVCQHSSVGSMLRNTAQYCLARVLEHATLGAEFEADVLNEVELVNYSTVTRSIWPCVFKRLAVPSVTL